MKSRLMTPATTLKVSVRPDPTSPNTPVICPAKTESDEARTDLREAVAASLERGVFGSPFVFVDGEPFWGSDRLEQIDDWLARGGW